MKLTYALSLLIICILTACSGATTPENLAGVDPITKNNSEAESEVENPYADQEVDAYDTDNYENFLGYQVKLGCEVAAASAQEDPEAVLAVFEYAADYAAEFGLDEQTAYQLTIQYQNDTVVQQEILVRMQENCPDTMNALAE